MKKCRCYTLLDLGNYWLHDKMQKVSSFQVASPGRNKNNSTLRPLSQNLLLFANTRSITNIFVLFFQKKKKMTNCIHHSDDSLKQAV